MDEVSGERQEAAQSDRIESDIFSRKWFATTEALEGGKPSRKLRRPERPAPCPRPWPALVTVILAITAAILVSLAALYDLAVADSGGNVIDGLRSLNQGTFSLLDKPEALLALVLPGQVVLFAVAVAAAILSRQPIRSLGLNSGASPAFHGVIYVLATPAIGLVWSLWMTAMFQDMGDPMRMVSPIILARAEEHLLEVILLVAVGPAVAEEMLFRGYLQTRLLRCWGPAAAILVSTLLFSASHCDPTYMICVLPLGLWFSVVAWRAGSIRPAILCHLANNLFAVLALVTRDAEDPSSLLDPYSYAALVVGLPAFLLSLFLLRRGHHLR